MLDNRPEDWNAQCFVCTVAGLSHKVEMGFRDNLASKTVCVSVNEVENSQRRLPLPASASIQTDMYVDIHLHTRERAHTHTHMGNKRNTAGVQHRVFHTHCIHTAARGSQSTREGRGVLCSRPSPGGRSRQTLANHCLSWMPSLCWCPPCP